MIQYVKYCRVSTKRQGSSGLGLDAQDRDIQIFLERYSPKPYEVIGEFTDIESGAHNDRPQLDAALSLCRKTGATLVVAKLDRLSRRVSFIATLMEDKSLNFKVAQMPNAEKIQLHIFASLAEQERDFISVRTKAALEQAKLRGVKLGGYRDPMNNRSAAYQEQAQGRADKLKNIIRPLHRDGATLQHIADTLNGAGLRTARGCEWGPSQVFRALERFSIHR